MKLTSLDRLKFAAALVIKTSSDFFANPAYKPTGAPVSKPGVMPPPKNHFQSGVDAAADKLMMPQVKAVAHHGQHGFNPQMQFKNKQLVGVTQPHFQKPGTPEFSKGVATTK